MPDLYALIARGIFGLNDVVWGWPAALPLIVVLLVGTGLVTTLRLGWIQVRWFVHGLRVIRGDYDDPEHAGDLSHFQALTTALSATVGIGNIAGVATAIHYGGPGALFWMWVTAVFGMALKFTECTLAMRYRTTRPDGTTAGGPMYTIERGLGRWARPLALAFAGFTVISSFGSGNAVQSFTVADQLRQDLGLATWFTGLLMAGLVAAVILGGIRRIGAVTARLVPFMAALYVGAGLLVLALHVERIPAALGTILASALSPAAPVGGFAGAGFIFMLTWGVKRGLFSNESGQGSAPIAHAAAKTDEPIREGVVAMIGPFIDTLVICSMTGLVIVTTGVWHERLPETVRITEQAAIVAIDGAADVLPEGVVPDAALARGTARVEAGRPLDVRLVRNHATIERARLLVGGDSVLVRAREPLSGTIAFDPEHPGDVARAVVRDAAGRIVGEPLVVEGDVLQNGSPLTAWAFRTGLGRFALGRGHLLITLAVFLFGLSTAISWSYYGETAVVYLFGTRFVQPYRLVFCVMHFLGAVYSLELVWAFGDAALGLMTLPNLLAILLLTGRVRRWAREYAEGGGLEPPATPGRAP